MNPNTPSKLRSFLSISLFVILVLGVALMSWNFVQALIHKLAPALLS
jgi:hypothetical protein